MATPPRVVPVVAVGPVRFADSCCGRLCGLFLISYAALNTGLFIKFTPVYQATECGDQMGEMDNLELGKEIRVGLKIQVTCWNPNGYAVQVMTSEPGQVWVGKDRESVVGELSLVKGSILPEKSSGDIHVRMDAKLSEETSMGLVPHFLEDPEIPMYLELQFDVAVSVGFMGKRLGISAPFKKKCGMIMSGLLVNSASRLGPMICRNSWEELSDLPHAGEAPEGRMSFSAAQMDPERIRMGEAAKNVSIIGVGGLCYIVGFWLLFQWFASCIKGVHHTNNVYDKVGALDQSGRRWCTRGYSGNLVEPQVDNTMSLWQPRSCLRASSGNLVEPPPKPVVDDTFLTRATRLLVGFTPYSKGGFLRTSTFERERELVAWEDRAPRPACGCIAQPMWNFITCGAGCNRAGRSWQTPRPDFQP